MQFDLNDDQQALMTALENLTRRCHELPADHRRVNAYFDVALDRDLQEGGFLDCVRTEGMGPLEAAMVVQSVAKLPVLAEAGLSGLAAPAVSDTPLPRPLTNITGDISKPQRLLTVAKAAFMDVGDDILLLDVDPDNVEPQETIFAYPYGRFKKAPDLSKARRLGADKVEVFRQRARLAVAAEISGSMISAVEFVNDYVKNRKIFGRTLGSHQAVHHRLAQCYQISRALEFLVLRAAWLDEPLQGAMAASYAQQYISKVVFDLHQFNGGMGQTFENKLHFWTYRIRALQPELGGVNASALDIADRLWGAASTGSTRTRSTAPAHTADLAT